MSGGQGRNARRRAEAEAREEADRSAAESARRHRRRTGALALGLAVVVAVAGGAYLVVQERRADDLDRRMVARDCTRDSRADRQTGGEHVPSPTYAVEPPAGGDHTDDVAKAGTYPAAEAPKDGALVHAMEHGYVVVWHHGVSAANLAVLVALVDRHRGDVILVERPRLPVAVAATAWEERLLCGGVEEDALEAFTERFVGKGPENVGRG